MTSGCPDDKNNHGLKLFGFGIPAQGFYSMQMPGLQKKLIPWVLARRQSLF